MKTISEIIEAGLERLNTAHPGVSTGRARSGHSIDKLNRNLEKISVELDGKDFDSAKVAQIPNCFKKQPLVWQCLGSDIALEVYQ
jgi:hypothetical protein